MIPRQHHRTLVALVALASMAAPLVAAEIAERPFAVLTASRLDRLLDSVDVLLDVAERPEFSDVLAERYRSARDFGGIDRTRPFGVMRTWRVDDPATAETEQPADVLFLPVSDRDELLKTITFDVVTYQQVAADHIVIDRPDAPYHVLFRDGYAWLGDDVGQLAAFANRRERILREISRSAQLALLIDVGQIPLAARETAVEQWLQSTEPLLQRRDEESDQAYAWRRKRIEWIIRSGPAVVDSARQVLISQTLDATERRSVWTVELQVADDSPLAKALQRWPSRATPLARLDQQTAASYGVIRGIPLDDQGEPWDLAWQVFGHPFVQRTAVVVADGPGLSDLVARWPASSPQEIRLGDDVLRRVTLPATPVWLKRFIGWDPEVWLGSAAGRVWLGCGPPDAVRQQLEAAHKSLAAPLTAADRPVGVRLRLSARDLVGLVPGLQPGWADQQLARGGDQIQVAVESEPKSLEARITLDVGVLRVLGAAIAHELSLELDQMLQSMGNVE